MWMLLGTAIAGGDVRIGSMTVNDVEARDVTCQLNGFDLTWMLKFQAVIGDSKAAGDACVGAGRAVRLAWDWRGATSTGVPTVLATEATAKEQKCLVKVLSAPPPNLDARCEATLLYGEKLPAQAAADALATRLTAERAASDAAMKPAPAPE